MWILLFLLVTQLVTRANPLTRGDVADSSVQVTPKHYLRPFYLKPI
jgi:hypothetical protein